MRIYEFPIAHRGLHGDGITENSESAFRAAMEKNYNIEIDVRFTKDKKVVVFHDASFRRMFKIKRAVRRFTYAELQTDRFKYADGGHIMLFEDLIKMIDGKVDILCEIKFTSYLNFKLEKAVYALIKDKPWITIQSFSPYTVAWFHKNAPEVCRGQLAAKANTKAMKALYKIVNPYKSLANGAPDFLAYNINHLPSKRIEEAVKNYNLKLITWTVNTPEKIALAKELGAANIIFEDVRP